MNVSDSVQEAETLRLRRLSAVSQDRAVLLVEFVLGRKWVQFDIGVMQLKHLPPEELWRRYMVPALKAVDAPNPIVAKPEPEPVFGVPV